MVTTHAKQWLRRRAADVYIWAFLLTGAAALYAAATNWQLRDRRQFLAYLLTAIAAVSAVVQSRWRPTGQVRAIQVCWNVSSVSVAVYVSGAVYGWAHHFMPE